MAILIIASAFVALVLATFRGYSLILCAPIVAAVALLLTNPGAVAPMMSGVYMKSLADFIQFFMPIILLGSVFGKLYALSGFSETLAQSILRVLGPQRGMMAVVLAATVITYGGVSPLVVAFTIYPFAAEVFQRLQIPKRLIPACVTLGALSLSVSTLPGGPHLTNIIPSVYFSTTAWAGTGLGFAGATFEVTLGMLYLEWERRRAARMGEPYTRDPHDPLAPPTAAPTTRNRSAVVALLPLLIILLMNRCMADWLAHGYTSPFVLDLIPVGRTPDGRVSVNPTKLTPIWAASAALTSGCVAILCMAYTTLKHQLIDGCKTAVRTGIDAAMNTASQVGYGNIIIALPGFALIGDALAMIANPLLREASELSLLAIVMTSPSGALSITLSRSATLLIEQASAAGIPIEVFHRVASAAAAGLDTMPHNGTVITMLTLMGLSHRQAYLPIFVITLIKGANAFFMLGLFYTLGIH